MAKLPKTTKIENELKDGWLTIWFNSPENRNALGDELAGDFTNTLKAVRNDRSVRGITMRGRHSVFCAGGISRASRPCRTPVRHGRYFIK